MLQINYTLLRLSDEHQVVVVYLASTTALVQLPSLQINHSTTATHPLKYKHYYRAQTTRRLDKQDALMYGMGASPPPAIPLIQWLC